MKLIVGLGNPGAQYARTRHNAGFMAVDRLKDRHAPAAIPRERFRSLVVETPIRGAGKCVLMKPLTYMNRSGEAVAEAVRFFKADPSTDLLILVDDVALPVGSVRLRAGGSAGGHNGLSDIERTLATDQYARCRIGIDPPGIVRQSDYVLGRFSAEQTPEIEHAINIACDATEAWAEKGIEHAMNLYNVKPRAPAPETLTPPDTPPDAPAPRPQGDTT